MWFVYRDDDYHGNGGIGLEIFEGREDALDHIASRMQITGRTAESYILIKGEQILFEPVEVVKKLRVVQ